MYRADDTSSYYYTQEEGGWGITRNGEGSRTYDKDTLLYHKKPNKKIKNPETGTQHVFKSPDLFYSLVIAYYSRIISEIAYSAVSSLSTSALSRNLPRFALVVVAASQLSFRFAVLFPSSSSPSAKSLLSVYIMISSFLLMYQ